MTPEEKQKLINELIQKAKEISGITPEVEKEITESLHRGINLLKEWSQDGEDIDKLPQQIKDVKNAAKYNMFCALSGEQSIPASMQGIEMAIESAFNLGKANVPKG